MGRKKQPVYEGETQKTLRGNIIPLPTRREIMDAFAKVAKAPKKG